jgi:hypothetical protein
MLSFSCAAAIFICSTFVDWCSNFPINAGASTTSMQHCWSFYPSNMWGCCTCSPTHALCPGRTVGAHARINAHSIRIPYFITTLCSATLSSVGRWILRRGTIRGAWPVVDLEACFLPMVSLGFQQPTLGLKILYRISLILHHKARCCIGLLQIRVLDLL